MARDNRNKPARGVDEPQEQEELTVVVLKFKGGSHSLQKGFDAVTQAINALGPNPPNNGHRVVVQRPQAQIAARNAEILDAEPEDFADLGATELEDTEQKTPVTTKPKRTFTAPKYTFMNDFNLTPDSVPSLREYCTEKNSQTENDKFLVASAWIMTHGGVDPFTASHLFTAFRAMEWKTQVDMTQPLRIMKSKKSYYENPSQGKWKLTAIGLTAAENVGKE
jgi:hypothetical protein